MTQTKTFPMCMTVGCKRVAQVRGHCAKHYGSWNNLVQQGRISWYELEKKGKVLPSTKTRIPFSPRHKCLISGCPRKGYTRGLCHTCYLDACANVKGGRTTWKKLEQRGLALPYKTKGNGHYFERALSGRE